MLFKNLQSLCPGGGTVYTQDLKFCGESLEGSNPSPGTILKHINVRWSRSPIIR